MSSDFFVSNIEEIFKESKTILIFLENQIELSGLQSNPAEVFYENVEYLLSYGAYLDQDNFFQAQMRLKVLRRSNRRFDSFLKV